MRIILGGTQVGVVGRCRPPKQRVPGSNPGGGSAVAVREVSTHQTVAHTAQWHSPLALA